jgi:AcrR family transcriptional regulator
MAPRRYTQKSRAAAAEETRSRIITAAVAEYRERGVQRASISSIAARADVSRGTILNHFDDFDGVLAAVLESALSSIVVPDETVFGDATDRFERAHVFAAEMLRFYDRTEDWWHVFAGERDELPESPAIEAAEQRFWADVGRFQHAALGDLAAQPYLLGAMSVLVSWNTIGQMESVGLSVDAAVDLAADLFTDAVRHAASMSQNGG